MLRSCTPISFGNKIRCCYLKTCTYNFNYCGTVRILITFSKRERVLPIGFCVFGNGDKRCRFLYLLFQHLYVLLTGGIAPRKIRVDGPHIYYWEQHPLITGAFKRTGFPLPRLVEAFLIEIPLKWCTQHFSYQIFEK